MELYAKEMIEQLGANFSWVIYFFVLLAGIVTSIGPCNMSMVPVVMAVVAGNPIQSRWQGFKLSGAFVLGSSITFMTLGLVIAGVGGLFGRTNMYLYYLVGAISILFGLRMLGILNFNLSLNQDIKGESFQGKGVWGALTLGIVMGLVSSQCGTPILLVILSLVMVEGSMAYGASLLFVYALGRGVPVVLAGTFTGVVKNMGQIAKWATLMEKFAGVILIVIGLYYFWLA